jgi:hypothetical protein
MNRDELLVQIQAVLEEVIDGMQWVSEKRKPYYIKARASEILDMIEGLRSEIEDTSSAGHLEDAIRYSTATIKEGVKINFDWVPIRTFPVAYEHGTWYRDGDMMEIYTETCPPIFPNGFEYDHSLVGFTTNPNGSYRLKVKGWARTTSMVEEDK